LNNAGNGIESVDASSSAGECTGHGGYWVSGQVNQLTVDDSGGYHFGYTGMGADGNLQTISYAQYQTSIFNKGGDHGGVNPGFLGPGDYALASQVEMPAYVSEFVGRVFGSLLGKGVEEVGASVEEILSKAGSAVGNQSIKASSRAAAEDAAEKWVGSGAKPIYKYGEPIG
jgi:hypothetical protein